MNANGNLTFSLDGANHQQLLPHTVWKEQHFSLSNSVQRDELQLWSKFFPNLVRIMVKFFRTPFKIAWLCTSCLVFIEAAARSRLLARSWTSPYANSVPPHTSAAVPHQRPQDVNTGTEFAWSSYSSYATQPGRLLPTTCQTVHVCCQWSPLFCHDRNTHHRTHRMRRRAPSLRLPA